MFQSPRNRVNTSNKENDSYIEALAFGFNPLEIGSTLQIQRVKESLTSVDYAKFQSPRNRVNTSNGNARSRRGGRPRFCFNPLEIGSTLQISET